MAAKKVALSWNEKGESLLKNYLKKTKSSSGGIAVLSRYGETLWKEGKWKVSDWTSLGSLVTALKATTDGLNESLKLKTKKVILGDEKSGCWICEANGQWLIVGIKTVLKESLLKDILRLLKSAKSGSSRTGLSQELAGMSVEGIESALGKDL